jgi:hypothetical protein
MATQSEMAASYGYTLAFFNSNPELKSLLSRATSANYSVARFVAELQNTNWFRTSSESFRKYQALKSGDPATFASQLNALAAHIWNAGGEMGATLDATTVNQLSHQAMQLGWNEDQLKRVLNTMVTAVDGHYTGMAGVAEKQFQGLADDYGVTISPDTLRDWVRRTSLGVDDPRATELRIQQMAMSKYTALKDRIAAGETVRQIADPYIQSYSKLLETAPESVGLNDNMIQRALTARDPKGQPTTQTLYDFENSVRNDPRWAKTKNAQDSMSATASKILQTFGLMG